MRSEIEIDSNYYMQDICNRRGEAKSTRLGKNCSISQEGVDLEADDLFRTGLYESSYTLQHRRRSPSLLILHWDGSRLPTHPLPQQTSSIHQIPYLEWVPTSCCVTKRFLRLRSKVKQTWLRGGASLVRLATAEGRISRR